MFDDNISGELPEHIDFIKNKAIPLFESWGYEVQILHSDKTYMDEFNHIVLRSKHPERIGKRCGFPMSGKCVINGQCKIKPIKTFFKDFPKPYIQYIGIAADEPNRLARMHNDATRVSLLEKYSYTEEMALNLCKKYNLVSPIYEYSTRGVLVLS